MAPLILVPTDGSPESASAVRYAARLARCGRARVILLCAGDVPGSAELLASARDMLIAQSVRVEAITFPLDPVKAITRTARLRSADLVVMGRHGSGGSNGRPLGSVTDAVGRRCQIPVLLAPSGISLPESDGIEGGLRAVVFLDGSRECEGVLPAIRRLGSWVPLSVRLVGLVEDGDSSAEDMLAGIRDLSAPFARTGTEVKAQVVPRTDPAAWARAIADEAADLLFVLPVRGDWPAETGSFGPLTSSVLAAVWQSVLLVRVESFAPLGAVAGCIHE